MSTAFNEVNEVADAKANRKKRAAFYTPLALVDRLVEWADVSEFTRCLEPSGGDGRIAHALRKAGVPSVDVCEIESAMHERITAAGGTVVADDFLKYTPGPVYDRVVMNPPFKGDSADRHIEHAWSLLRPDGKVLSLATTMTDSRLRANRLKMPGCEWATSELLDGRLFKEFETGIKVVVVELVAGPYPPVDGFSNAATANAALTVTNDADLMGRWVKGGEGVRRELQHTMTNEANGSVYGICWDEVWEYVRLATPGVDVEPSPTKRRKQVREPSKDRTLFD